MADKCKAFTVTIKGDPAKVFEEVKKAAKGQMEIKGDATKGSIQVKKVDVKGTYAVKGQKITFNMIDNTMWVDCDGIKKRVEEYFKGK